MCFCRSSLNKSPSEPNDINKTWLIRVSGGYCNFDAGNKNEAVWTWNEKAERKFKKKIYFNQFLKVLNILICIKYCT